MRGGEISRWEGPVAERLRSFSMFQGDPAIAVSSLQNPGFSVRIGTAANAWAGSPRIVGPQRLGAEQVQLWAHDPLDTGSIPVSAPEEKWA